MPKFSAIRKSLRACHSAYPLQSSVSELTDLSRKPEAVWERYDPDARKPGTFAANCILARRLAERGVRFIQLFHRGWHQHSNYPKQIASNAATPISRRRR